MPDEADCLKLKLLTVKHAGKEEHRGGEATAAALREEFTWNGLTTIAKYVFSIYLLCLLSRSGAKVPRPLATTLHDEKPNDVLQFDYLYLGESDNDEKYVFVVKGDFSCYAWLGSASNASATHAVEVMSWWESIFTARMYWVSDQSAHFMNDLLP